MLLPDTFSITISYFSSGFVFLAHLLFQVLIVTFCNKCSGMYHRNIIALSEIIIPTVRNKLNNITSVPFTIQVPILPFTPDVCNFNMVAPFFKGKVINTFIFVSSQYHGKYISMRNVFNNFRYFFNGIVVCRI